MPKVLHLLLIFTTNPRRAEKLAIPCDDGDMTYWHLTCQVESLGLPVKVAQLEPASPNINHFL
jgi:hypothetical protein